MLSELQVCEFALIKEIKISLSHGLTVLTGETGAGKSILIAALNFVLGAQASKDMVRKGAEKTTVKAVFEWKDHSDVVKILQSASIDTVNDHIYVFMRTMFANGRSRSTINGKQVSLDLLRRIRASGIDLMSQFEQLGLMSTDVQLEYLDLYGGRPLKEVKTKYEYALEEWRTARDRLGEAKVELADIRRLQDLYLFQIEELEGSQIDSINETDLLDESRRLQCIEKISNAGISALNELVGDGSVTDKLNTAIGFLADKQYLEEEFSESIEDLQCALESIEQKAKTIRSQALSLEADPTRLNSIEEQLHSLALLKKKYVQYIYDEGLTDIGSIIDLSHIRKYLDHIKDKIERIEIGDDRLAELEKTEQIAGNTAIRAADDLSRTRIDTARDFEKAIAENLAELNLKRTDVKIAFMKPEHPAVEHLGDHGYDSINMLIALNPGEDLMPLSAVASGGELSRVLLGIKVALNRIDFIPTLVFDEIDVGIGGETALCVGKMLASLGQHHQIICITHLPQIAAYANRHMYIHKSTVGSRTIIQVDPLKGTERIPELARMLSGTTDSDLSQAHARELLELADNKSISR